MAKRNRTCICCQQGYEYCPTCGNDRLKPTWMVEFCSEDCKTLWETATKFNMGKTTKEEAAKTIEGLTLKERSTYAECVQKDLENILGAVKPIKTLEKSHEVVYKK